MIDGQQVRRPGHACGMVHAVPLKRFRASLMRRPPDDDGSVGVGVARLDPLDVEGSELAVLRGAARALATDRPAVMVEINRGMSARYGFTPGETFSFLAGMGYERSEPIEATRGPSKLFLPSESS